MREFSTVFRGSVNVPKITNKANQREVAVKTYKNNLPAAVLKSALSEIEVLIYIGRHENIVRLIGVYATELHKGEIPMKLSNLDS